MTLSNLKGIHSGYHKQDRVRATGVDEWVFVGIECNKWKYILA